MVQKKIRDIELFMELVNKGILEEFINEYIYSHNWFRSRSIAKYILLDVYNVSPQHHNYMKWLSRLSNIIKGSLNDYLDAGSIRIISKTHRGNLYERVEIEEKNEDERNELQG